MTAVLSSTHSCCRTCSLRRRRARTCLPRKRCSVHPCCRSRDSTPNSTCPVMSTRRGGSHATRSRSCSRARVVLPKSTSRSVMPCGSSFRSQRPPSLPASWTMRACARLSTDSPGPTRRRSQHSSAGYLPRRTVFRPGNWSATSSASSLPTIRMLPPNVAGRCWNTAMFARVQTVTDSPSCRQHSARPRPSKRLA